MQCGIACLQMVCKYFGREYTLDSLSKLCFATAEGVSLLGINEAANTLGLHTTCARATTMVLGEVPLPCILHWNQNHFVVLYKVKKGKNFYVADPGKGLVVYTLEEFKQHWISTNSNGEDKGIAMFLETTPAFFTYKMQGEENIKEKRSFRFLFGYVKKYRKYFGQIILGLIVGSLLQLVLPFLTQSIVDVGIKNQDIGFVWLILLGQLMLTISRTAIDFIRRWLLLHISLRINISLVSDFFIKLLKLPMSLSSIAVCVRSQFCSTALCHFTAARRRSLSVVVSWRVVLASSCRRHTPMPAITSVIKRIRLKAKANRTPTLALASLIN